MGKEEEKEIQEWFRKYRDKSIDDRHWAEALKSGFCTLPLINEYTTYALASVKGKPTNEMVDSLFDKMDTVLHKMTDEDGKPLTGDSAECQGNLMVYREVCPLLKTVEKAKTRLDKVLAIEEVIQAIHEEGVGRVLQYICDMKGLPPEAATAYSEIEGELVNNLLNLLFERR